MPVTHECSVGRTPAFVVGVPERPRWRVRRWLMLKRDGVDFAFYTSPNVAAIENRIPFCMPIHDLNHRLNPHFPEVSAGGEWHRREILFGNAVRYGSQLLVDSVTGRNDVLSCYSHLGITDARLSVVRFSYPMYLTVPNEKLIETTREKYSLPHRFLFYPAQYWAHKNHKRLLRALAHYNSTARRPISLVLSGSHSGEFREEEFRAIKSLIGELRLESFVRILGYIPVADMAPLYRAATALIMPTFFGPTNIPIVEAWAMDTPVIASRIDGMVEQIGSAGILVDPSSVTDIAKGIDRLLSNPAVVPTLVARGRKRAQALSRDKFKFQVQEAVLKGLNSPRSPWE
jgi:glycosyltransferase involved in cell wall biosynthesis